MSEIPFTLAFLYPSLNYLWHYPIIRPTVEKEVQHKTGEIQGVELYEYQMRQQSSVMINTGTKMVPVGGQIYQEQVKIYSQYTVKPDNSIYINYKDIDGTLPTRIYSVNTPDDLSSTLNYYRIPRTHFKMTLPIQVRLYNYKSGLYFHKSGPVSQNREKVIKYALYKNRLPFTFIVPMTAGLCLASCWIYYTFSYGSYRPPFYIKCVKQ